MPVSCRKRLVSRRYFTQLENLMIGNFAKAPAPTLILSIGIGTANPSSTKILWTPLSASFNRTLANFLRSRPAWAWVLSSVLACFTMCEHGTLVGQKVRAQNNYALDGCSGWLTMWEGIISWKGECALPGVCFTFHSCWPTLRRSNFSPVDPKKLLSNSPWLVCTATSHINKVGRVRAVSPV